MPYKSIMSGYFSLIINIILQLGDPRTILMTYQQKKTRLMRFEHTIWRLTDILTTKLNTPACDNLLLGVSIIDLNRIRVQGIIHGFNTKFTNFMLDFMPFFTYFLCLFMILEWILCHKGTYEKNTLSSDKVSLQSKSK